MLGDLKARLIEILHGCSAEVSAIPTVKEHIRQGLAKAVYARTKRRPIVVPVVKGGLTRRIFCARFPSNISPFEVRRVAEDVATRGVGRPPRSEAFGAGAKPDGARIFLSLLARTSRCPRRRDEKAAKFLRGRTRC